LFPTIIKQCKGLIALPLPAQESIKQTIFHINCLLLDNLVAITTIPMQKIIAAICVLTAFSSIAHGQTNFEKFKTLFKDNDTTEIKKLLKSWEQTNANDPELYTSAFNFYYSGSKHEVISIQKAEPESQSLQITDSTGEVAGYLTSNMGYNEEILDKAMQYVNKGIEKFPDRLDIRFGKIYVLGAIGEYGKFTEEVIKTIEYSAINKNKWLWTENEKKEDSQNFMLDNIQAYLKQLYDTEDDELLSNMIQIGETTLKYYPKSVEILSTTSVAFMLTKQYDKAISYLEKAEKINPEDVIVLNNIAEAYRRKGDNEHAIKYYLLVEKYGNEEIKEEVRRSIEKLKK
jgi:tetratricopeptide (TPR) repeat protein